MWFGRRNRVKICEHSEDNGKKPEKNKKDKRKQSHKNNGQEVKDAQRTSKSEPKPTPKPSSKPLASKSTPNLLAAPVQHPPANANGQLRRPRSSQFRQEQAVTRRGVGYMNQSAALADRIQDRMNTVLTSLDSGDPDVYVTDTGSRALVPPVPPLPPRSQALAVNSRALDTKLPQSSHFDRVWLYSNSRLPPYLMPLKLYLPTYPILCLAAQHSLTAYQPTPTKPSASAPHRAPSVISTFHAVPASLRSGTKAFTIATSTHDTATSPLVLIAIRGSSTFMDWAVNARQEPVSPQGFLTDPGNLCHAGFLEVARKMSVQIASQLQRLLSEKPERRRASVVLTGHSAGGAVAALLYMHVLSFATSTPAQPSDLASVASMFKRVHCITFGAPPVSLLPLQKPEIKGNRRVEKSMFFAFVNEGDPVARADKEYVKSLLVLYTTPPPSLNGSGRGPIWPTPPGTLSCAGRLVLLRPRNPIISPQSQQAIGRDGQTRALFKKSSTNLQVQDADVGRGEKIEACMINDEMLRGAVFGDPMMHAMRLYADRIERMAVEAVTVGGVARG